MSNYNVTTLGMEILRGKTPHMVRKEIYVYLLAYNLLRSLMWEAGTTYGVPPLRCSLNSHFTLTHDVGSKTGSQIFDDSISGQSSILQVLD
ncbi:hypothetical protein HW132_15160 [Brasilonema sp. CT11]|nr:hypothetical protein [Brasilonema sp. CT11]